MHGSRVLLLVLLLSLCRPLSAAGDVRLVDYIDALRDSGVTVLYSDNLVRGDTRVAADAARPDVETLGRVLGPLGLALESGPGGAVLIVRAGAPGPIVSGVVRSSNGIRLSGATVTADGGGTALTDARGVFSVDLGNAARATLRITAPGYLPEQRGVDPDTAARSGLQFTLAPVASPLETIVVSASRYQLAFARDDRATLIDAEQLDTLPLLAGETVRAIGLLPAATSTGADARLHVRGGDFGETLYLLDGVRIYEPYHLRGFQTPASIFNSNAVDTLEFFSGGFPARYRDRMSAVLSVDLRDPIERPETILEISTLNTSATYAGARDDGRAGWLVSARRSNLDLVLERLNGDYGAPRFGEALLRGIWRGGDTHTVSANLLYVNDNVALDTGRGETAGADDESIYGWVRWQFAPSPALSVDSVLSLTDVDRRRDGRVAREDTGSGQVVDERTFRILALTQDWRWRYSPRLLLSGGIDLRYVEARYRYASELGLLAPFDAIGAPVAGATRSVSASPDGGQYAAYADARWQWGGWIVEAGARWDLQPYTDASNDGQVSPRVSAGYDFGDRTRLRIGWGRYYQSQGVNELPIAAGITAFDAAQRSEHLVASLEHQFRRPYRLRIEAYRKRERALRDRYENLFDPLVLLPELQFDWVRIARRQALHRGVEVLLARERLRGPIAWWVSYAWSDSVEDTPAGRLPTSWDQTHSLRAGLHWQRGPWDVTLTAAVRDGWPRTTLTAEDDGNGGLTLAAGRRNAERAPTFHTMDLHVARALRVPRGSLSVFLDINNLYDRRNLCCVEYAIETGDDGAPVLVEDRDGWLPLVPTLGVTWRF